MNVPRRKSTRAKGYDYSLSGRYFITVCTAKHRCLLGSIDNHLMHENRAGRLVRDAWKSLPDQFPTVTVDAFVVMPNHIHGIVVFAVDLPGIGENRSFEQVNDFVAAECPETYTRNWSPSLGSMNRTRTNVNFGRAYAQAGPVSLGKVVRVLKAVSTRKIRVTVNPDFAWQRNYYDHIIRDDRDMDRIRTYIDGNPGSWFLDSLHKADAELENA